MIIAHAASLGECDDRDSREPKNVSCFDLFLRMMDEPKYRGLLFGEISAMLQFNRFWAKHVPGIKPTAGYPGNTRRKAATPNSTPR